MNKHRLITAAALIAFSTTTGCAYRYYLGMHGPSTKNYPDFHLASIKEDSQCLGCHATKEETPDAPQTTHPNFQGCLKCHSDEVKL